LVLGDVLELAYWRSDQQQAATRALDEAKKSGKLTAAKLPRVERDEFNQPLASVKK
jgi:hypothetical protein